MMWPAWERFLQECLLFSALCRSAELDKTLQDWWRCLPRPTMNARAWFGILARKAFAPRHHGGLKCPRNRQKVAQSFADLAKRSDATLGLSVVVGDDFEATGLTWVVGGLPSCVLRIECDRDLNVDLVAFRQRLRDIPTASAMKRILSSVFADPEM